MTDRPMIFSAPMVRALLEGRKTQTRRLLKPQPPEGDRFLGITGPIPKAVFNPHHPKEGSSYADNDTAIELRCGVGDRVWVKEAWRTVAQDDGKPPSALKADPLHVGYQADCPAGSIPMAGRLRSPIHMPRWASRLTLHVTDVRVQRLQEISGADARAEGVERLHGGYHDTDDVFRDYCDDGHGYGGFGGARLSFVSLWDTLHGPDAWEANPWVAALTFEFERANIDQARSA